VTGAAAGTEDGPTRPPTARNRRIAVGLLLAIAAIPLGAAVSKLIGARDLIGGSSTSAGRVVAHHHVQPVGKSASQRWYTTIALADARSVDAESRTLYDAVSDRDLVAAEVAGSDHVVSVRLPDGRRIPIGDDPTTAMLGAALWGALGLLIASAALLLGRRARRMARAS
jgi:hypothetical protein